jgi:hypothetical protein
LRDNFEIFFCREKGGDTTQVQTQLLRIIGTKKNEEGGKGARIKKI